MLTVFGVVSPANADHALFGFIKTAEEINNGRFTTTGRANKSDGLALFDMQVEILQHRFFFFIVEIHVVKFDVSTH